MLVFSTATHSRSVEVAPQNSLDIAFGPLFEMLGNHSHSVSVYFYIRISCVCYWNTVCRLTDTLANKTPLSTPANPIQSNSSMHRYECMVLCKDISLQRGRFCARSLASYIPRSSENRSSWMFFFTQVVCCRPGDRLQFSGGGSKHRCKKRLLSFFISVTFLRF